MWRLFALMSFCAFKVPPQSRSCLFAQGQGAFMPHQVCRHPRPLPTRLGPETAAVTYTRAQFKGLWPLDTDGKSPSGGGSSNTLGRSDQLSGVAKSADSGAFGR